MVGHIWFLLAISLAPMTFTHANPSIPEYGVGFELTLDYGVASIYYSNGSNVNVAKIEGSPAYKQLMRTADARDDNIFIGFAQVIDTQVPVGLQSLRGYLPPWLGGHNQTRGSLSLSPMLKALKTASEAYVGASASTVQIAIPFPASHAFFDTLHSTLESLSVQMHLSTASLTSTRLLAGLYSYGIGPGKCFTPPSDLPKLFLIVEYTRSALTALMVFEDCGLYDVKRVLHETEAGADNLSKEPSSSHRVKLEKALRDLIRLPLMVDGETLASFSDVLLLGESAGDPLLHDALEDVLSKQQQPDNMLAAAVDRLKGPIDPVFAGATSAAHRALEQAMSSALNPDGLCQVPV